MMRPCLPYFLAVLLSQPVVSCGQETTSSITFFHESGILQVGPNPESKWEMFHELARLPELQDFLKLSVEERTEISSALEAIQEEYRGLSQLSKVDKEQAHARYVTLQPRIIETYFDPILKDRWEGLRNLGYRLEVLRSGYANAISTGRLASSVGVYADQRDYLQRRCKKLIQEADKKIALIQRETEDAILDELTSEQREKAKELLSGTLGFSEMTKSQRSFKSAYDEVNGLKSEDPR